MNLIPLSEYVELQTRTSTLDTSQIDWYDKEIEKLEKIRSYTRFLRQPLTLGMFVPVDENGNFMEAPENPKNSPEAFRYYDKYVKAKERVLFNVESKMGKCNGEQAIYLPGRPAQIVNDFSFLTIEDISHWGLPLTPSALKLIGEKEQKTEIC